jgi:hypothetical protein
MWAGKREEKMKKGKATKESHSILPKENAQKMHIAGMHRKQRILGRKHISRYLLNHLCPIFRNEKRKGIKQSAPAAITVDGLQIINPCREHKRAVAHSLRSTRT